MPDAIIFRLPFTTKTVVFSTNLAVDAIALTNLVVKLFN